MSYQAAAPAWHKDAVIYTAAQDEEAESVLFAEWQWIDTEAM